MIRPRLPIGLLLIAGGLGVRAGLAVADPGGGGGAMADRPLAVRSRGLGPEGGRIDTAAFTQALASHGIETQSATTSPATGPWRPAAEPPGTTHPLTVITAGFGQQAEAYAFLFSPSGETVERLAHVPYRQTYNANAATWVWIPPVAALAVEFHKALTQPPDPGRPVLGLQVVEATPPPGGGGGGDILAPAGEHLMHVMSAADARMPLDAMAWAAAFEAGWAPSATPGPTDPSAVLELHFHHQKTSLRIVLTAGEETVTVAKRNVPEETYHGTLRRLFLGLRHKGIFRDFFRPHDGRVQLIAASPERLILHTDDGPRVFDASTCGNAWTDGSADGMAQLRGHAFTQRTDPAGITQWIRYRPNLALIDPGDGAARGLAPVAAAQPWLFDIHDADHSAVVAAGTNLHLYRSNELIWQYTEPDSFTCGPVIAGDHVIAGTADGHLIGLDRVTGELRWRRILDPGLHGALIRINGRVLAYARATETLFAVDAGTGERLWQQSLGDVLLRAPANTPAGLLIATKANRLLLLDPETGMPRREHRFQTWLADVLWLPLPGSESDGVVACLARNGRLVFLDLADWSVRAEHALGVRAAGPMCFAAAFPTAWPGPADQTDIFAQLELQMTDLEPGLLIGDEEGYVTIIPLPVTRQ